MNLVPAVTTGPAEARIGDLRVETPAHGLALGTEVTLGIRPEDIVPGPRGDAGTGLRIDR